MNKKYYPSAFILYLNYFIHGIGCSILGQAVIKEMLVAQWGQGMDAIGQVTMVAAALGLGRLISLPIAGPLSDKMGRKLSSLIGIASYAIFFIGVAMSANMWVAYAAAILGGIANSFLDTGVIPACVEILHLCSTAAAAVYAGSTCRRKSFLQRTVVHQWNCYSNHRCAGYLCTDAKSREGCR